MKHIESQIEEIPQYIKLQYISNHIENEILNSSPILLPDTLKWRKLLYLSSHGYLGKYPGYFFNNNIQNEDYIDKLLNMNLISSDEELLHLNSLNDNNFNNSDNIERSYYSEGKINWSLKNNNDKNSKNKKNKKKYTNNLFNIKDLSLPSKIEKPKTENKVTISNKDYTISTELLENMMFNLYPRGSNKTSFITVSLDTYITPLLCIYYYEIEILNGMEDECDIVIGFIKDEIKNISFTSSSMIDLRGTDDKAVGWYGKNGYFTLWNDKRIEKSFCKFSKGDVVGLGYNLFNDSFFLTKNGLKIDEISSVQSFLDKSFRGSKNVKGFLPSISLGSWCSVKINLGNNDNYKFKFDINNYVKSNKYKFIENIKFSRSIPFHISNSKNKLVKSDLNLTDYVDKLVLGYLKYGGYFNTVKSLEKDLKDLKKYDNLEENQNDKKLSELCELKKLIKKYIHEDDIGNTRKLLENKYPGFFTTYRKIDFRLKILKLIQMLTIDENEILECVKYASQIKNLFREEDCQFYIDKVSVLFSYDDPHQCPEFNEYYDNNKKKIIYAIIMALNEQNNLLFISPLDLIILRTDQNVENYVDKIRKNKGPLLLNLLDDYIKF